MFEVGGHAGSAGDLHHATATLLNAVELWRGDLLQGLGLCGPLASWAEGLHEERRTATENLFDARLALGRHHEVTASLAVWTAKHPLRERAHAQLMLALYRSGRQREALDTHQRLRTTLITQIGAEPTPALQNLQHRILNTDPRLQPIPTFSLIMERAGETIRRASAQHHDMLDSTELAQS